jgi:hypothetical protein
MKRTLGLVALSLFGLAACVVSPGTEENDYGAGDVDNEATDIAGTVEGKAIMPVKGFAGAQTSNLTQAGIQYHNGPVMTGTLNVYIIWYGNWASSTTPTIIEDLAKNIGGTPYMNINSTYTNASGTPSATSVNFVKSIYDNYSNGTTSAKKKLSDSTIQALVSKRIGTGKEFPADANGIYFLITSQDVTATSGFCTQYCGWHSYGTLGGTANLKYSFLGDPARCITGCAAYSGTTPNGNAGADGLASIFAHELEEAGSDPQLNAWYDSSGYENADKCAWTFGTEYTTANGGSANMKIGTRDYLIQRNWVNAGASGYCATSY